MTPIRRAQFDVAGFAAWLSANGAEVCAPTNPYELIRYRAFWQGSAKALIHIVYTKDNGLLTYTGATQDHYVIFLMGGDLLDGPPPKKAKKRQQKSGAVKRYRENIRKRDGDDCWFCAAPLGDDCTLEHLLPVSKGGTNAPENLVLAHSACNGAAADLSISEKVSLRSRMRAALSAAGEAR